MTHLEHTFGIPLNEETVMPGSVEFKDPNNPTALEGMDACRARESKPKDERIYGELIGYELRTLRRQITVLANMIDEMRKENG